MFIGSTQGERLAGISRNFNCSELLKFQFPCKHFRRQFVALRLPRKPIQRPFLPSSHVIPLLHVKPETIPCANIFQFLFSALICAMQIFINSSRWKNAWKVLETKTRKKTRTLPIEWIDAVFYVTSWNRRKIHRSENFVFITFTMMKLICVLMLVASNLIEDHMTRWNVEAKWGFAASRSSIQPF